MKIVQKKKHFTTRDKATENRLKIAKSGKPIRNKDGKIVKQAPFQSILASGTQVRIQPNRKWFGNTRTITQDTLQKFKDNIHTALNDPYQVIITPSKLPTTLLHEKKKFAQPHILQVTKFQDVFGKRSNRKRPNINSMDYEELVSRVNENTEKFESKSQDILTSTTVLNNKYPLNVDPHPVNYLVSDTVFSKGQSKRIWNELYKVIDSADVLIQVLDARDPQGTRSKHIESFLKHKKAHKHLIFILNKCDLIPNWVCKKWVAYLSKQYPTLAYKASINECFGKGSLINLLRQFAKLHPERKQISVGFIGYPNVGKSSIINSLKSKKVCEVASTPGHTKVWQYITLMNRIYLIDCPGVVYPEGNSESDLILKGVVRVENVKDPENHIQTLIDKMSHQSYLLNAYDLQKHHFSSTQISLDNTEEKNLGKDPLITTDKKVIKEPLTESVKPLKVNDSSKDIDKETNEKNSKNSTILKEQVLDTEVGEGNSIKLSPKNEIKNLDSQEFLSALAIRLGKLLKGGDPDISTAAKLVLYDWQRGKIPFFSLPPFTNEKTNNIGNISLSKTEGKTDKKG
ncbi:unnamed protein product [Gordionus sp. m RMFG-2023]|uniref:uncharacterized protein LOC135927912 n=1 Tax=Gordionus sp. m RMFG-2023 TaxID=3053472 RepID=UPI0030E141B8